jgi:putative FmdB family regulatory protein
VDVPVYEYRCATCRATHEVIVLAGETAPAECPDCGGGLKRLWSRIGTQLVGWGFARNDALVPDDGRRSSFKTVRDKAAELFD